MSAIDIFLYVPMKRDGTHGPAELNLWFMKLPFVLTVCVATIIFIIVLICTQ